MTEQLTFNLPSHAVDADTAEILSLMSIDPVHERDTAAVVTAILSVAKDHDGVVDPNIVRPRIPSHVYPRCVGAAYNSLSKRGIITAIGWVVTEGSPGNNGKPARVWKLDRQAARHV